MSLHSPSYAVVWRENAGPRYVGRLELSGESAHLEGRSPVHRWRSRWIRLEDVSEVRIGRSESERIGGRRSLVLELWHGPRFVVSHLGGDDALHELADLLSAPNDGGRAA
jgi:hypothetical protein